MSTYPGVYKLMNENLEFAEHMKSSIHKRPCDNVWTIARRWEVSETRALKRPVNDFKLNKFIDHILIQRINLKS